MLGDLLTDTLNATVESIEVQTTFGPPIFIRDPFRKSPSAVPAAGGEAQPGSGPAPSGLDPMRLLKPKVILTMRGGGTNEFAPYGEPGASRWPWLAVGVTAGLGALIYKAFFAKCRR